MSKSRWTDYWLWGIIAAAALLRLPRIGVLTEFLGDQGRTLLIMRQFIEQGNIPLAGPTTLSGHHLGPVFYYLLAPGYLMGGNPLGVSVWVAFLGIVAVYLLYTTVHELFGVKPARLAALMWAVSSALVTADRIIWEPNMVPLFSVLFVFLLYRAYSRWHAVWWIAVGATVGVLLQLHYPNLYFVGLTGLVIVASYLLRLQPFRKVFVAALWWLFGFTLVLLPFLYYETTVQFRDLRGIFGVLGEGATVAIGKRAMIWQAMDYGFRVMGKMIPWMSRWTVLVPLFVWGVFLFVKPTKKNMFLTVWFAGGVAAMVRYSGVVHDHYLSFITPVPFLMLASVASQMKQKFWSAILIGIVALIALVQLTKTDLMHTGNNDIARTAAATRDIVRMSNGMPFTFTLFSSRSYSDLHYRYQLAVAKRSPLSITDEKSNILILVCDMKLCPPAPEVTKIEYLPALCYDEHCRGTYPSIRLAKDWSYVRDEIVSTDRGEEGRLYLFERKSQVSSNAQ
jgi:4-amino-4-deoxy-L-arabinose transferase-like glycosyltransferase